MSSNEVKIIAATFADAFPQSQLWRIGDSMWLAFVGRVEPKLHRDRGVLEAKGIWWDPGIKRTRSREKAFEAAFARLGRQIGAESISLP